MVMDGINCMIDNMIDKYKNKILYNIISHNLLLTIQKNEISRLFYFLQ